MDCSCAPMFRFFSVASDGATTERQIQNRVFGQFRTSLRKDIIANYTSIWTLFLTSITGPDVLCNALNNSQIRLQMAPQNSQNCGRHLRKRKQSDAEFAGNSLLRMVIIDIAINLLLSRVTRHPAGMHCPSWDDAFVSSLFFFCHAPSPERRAFEGCIVRTSIALPFIARFR